MALLLVAVALSSVGWLGDLARARGLFAGGNGRLAFVSDRDGNNEIYAGFEGTPEQYAPLRLTNNPASDFAPAWSASGQSIAFTSDRDGNDEIYVMNADGSGQTRVTVDPAADRRPAWSPTGTMIAFQSDRGGAGFHIWTMGADGSALADLGRALSLPGRRMVL